MKSSGVILFILLAALFVSAQQKQLLLARINSSQPDTSRISLFIQLGNVYINGASNNKQLLDSGYNYYKSALSLSEKLHVPGWRNKAMEKIADYNSAAGADTTAVVIEKQLAAIYHQNNELFNEANAWQKIGDRSTDFKYCHSCYEKANMLFLKTGHKLEAIGSLKSLGSNLLQAGKLDSSALILKEVVWQYQAIGYKKLQSTYDQLAIISKLKGFDNDELQYRLESIKCVEATGDLTLASYYYSSLGGTYRNLRQFQKSNFYEQKAVDLGGWDAFESMGTIVLNFLNLNKPQEALTYLRDYLRKYPFDPAKHRNVSELGYNESVMNTRYGEIYSALKQYNVAEAYFLKALTPYKAYAGVGAADKMIFQARTIILYQEIVKFYIRSGQFKKAQIYLHKIPDNLPAVFGHQLLANINLLHFKVDSAFGNYVSAIKHYQLYKALSDSIFNVKNMKAVAEVEAKYQTTKKEQAIKALQEEHDIQNLQIQKTELQRNATFAAIIITLTLTGFAYNGYRKKKLSSLLITQKNNQLQILLANKEHSNLLINQKNDQLQLLLIEKEWLLKEVHHRVKNNLHTVFCLLESQAKYLKDDSLKAVEVSQHRIYAMSLIHQKLYQSDDIKTVDMGVYLSEFISYLQESFDTNPQIRFNLDLAAITLNIAQAIPVALIINEAVTNAIKYAFPDGENGVIDISFHANDEDVTLEVNDNGVGIDPLIGEKESNSLGLVLMQGLAEDLHGAFTIENNKGTHVEVTFPIGVALMS